MNKDYKIIIWDFGGVLTNSPITNFSNYEKKCGLKLGTIVKINSSNNLNNAWALLEKNAISKVEFCALFKKESVKLGVKNIDPEGVLSCLNVHINQNMYKIFNLIKQKYKCVCLTNNINSHYLPFKNSAFELFKKNFVSTFESFKLGYRKPEKEIYTIVIDSLKVKPESILFLDDLGINLKPAKKIGINTYKVINTKDTINFLKKELKI